MINFKTYVALFQRTWVVSFLIFIAPLVWADESCKGDKTECVAIGKWDFSLALGYGSRSNPVVSNDTVPIILLPGISYYGERFFWDNDYIGYTLNDSATHMINIIGTISYDQIYFNRWGVGNFFVDSGFSGASISGDFSGISFDSSPDPVYEDIQIPTDSSGYFPHQGGPFTEEDLSSRELEDIDLDDLHDRNVAGLLGLEYLYSSENWSVALQATKDVTSVHSGNQARATFGYGLQFERYWWALSGGLEWKDENTLDYYFGIREDEVDNPENAYEVGSDTSLFMKLEWEYQLSRHWSWMAVLHQRWLGDEIRQSPLVEENTVTTVFTGGVYHF